MILAAAYSTSLNPKAKRKGDSGKAKRLGLVALWTALFLVFLYIFNLQLIDATSGAILGVFVGLAAAVVIALIYNARLNARLRRFAASHEDLRGESVATFDKDGVTYRNRHERFEARWAAVDHIVELHEGTGLRMGIGTMPVPDSALPKDMSPDAFRHKLFLWKASQ
ncbi:hypothetical protein [Roseovarius sp. THAF9]|uniref:hypothetical protein n=1 Tax=Roseovarius sp. THAF9 TaxID=2587847 RepID=UPI0012682D3C|nr:hypothetical protein [Roseovarius sp. THAF9]